MAFTLPDLPYSKTAFGDVISEDTFDYHYGKHHKAYVDKTNAAVEKSDMSSPKLSEVVLNAKTQGDNGLFNNSAQVWNHSFYWECLAPEGGAPSGELKDALERDFGSVDDFKKKFKEEATGHFASGWAWLVLDGDKLDITSFHDADTPIAHQGKKPVFTLDVWEHAYYLDYQNARPDYIDALLDKAVNWEFVAKNLDGKGVERADQQA
ncbi:MAG: superoxide dismutase [Novosphingopyxis baekryungensis]|jgi:Fe-Mn family superoxide dismutase|nr:superoxide dismutase [Novosphingopyxis baekryungensis]